MITDHSIPDSAPIVIPAVVRLAMLILLALGLMALNGALALCVLGIGGVLWFGLVHRYAVDTPHIYHVRLGRRIYRFHV